MVINKKMKFIRPFNRINTDLWANTRLKIIDRLIKCQNKKILDLGCGLGYLGLNYTKNNDVYFADIAQSDLEKIKVKPDKKFIINLDYPLPFKENFFDYIFCADVLEHISNDELVLKNIYKILKTNGEFIVIVPAYHWLYGHHDKIANHYRRYSNGELEKKTEQIGFQVMFSKYIFPLMLIPFIIQQKFIQSKCLYEGKSKIESKILPLLNLFSAIESRLFLPFGMALLVGFKKI